MHIYTRHARNNNGKQNKYNTTTHTSKLARKMGASDDVQVGPWGGSGNYPFTFKPDGKIIKIYVRSGGCIDSIKFGYVPTGSTQELQSPKYGGEGGPNSEEMYIQPGEEIIELSGTVGDYGGYTVVTSLCFKTNKKSCVFGNPRGEKFSLPVKANTTAKFVGFHGKSGSYLDSIGAILVPK